MDGLIKDMRQFAGMYIDDLLIFSDTLEDHCSHLRQVYSRLREEKFFCNMEKCKFAQEEVEYCGFIVGSEGVRPQPEKLAVIEAWPIPQDVEQVRSFLGMCAFYQRFVPAYAAIASPLYQLLRKHFP